MEPSANGILPPTSNVPYSFGEMENEENNFTYYTGDAEGQRIAHIEKMVNKKGNQQYFRGAQP